MVMHICPHCSAQREIKNCPRCGAVLDKAGICPAVCHRPPAPAPTYDGPEIIGLTHIGRMARP